LDANNRLKLIDVDYIYEDYDNFYISSGLDGRVEIVTSGMGIMVDGMKLKPFKPVDAVKLP
jgi:hypothetical protein